MLDAKHLHRFDSPTDQGIDALILDQREGCPLDQPFHTDASIFERDVERIGLRQWLFVDHVSRIPEPGDYLTFEAFGESIIVLRTEQGEINAFFNVCRHRGSRICLEEHGRVSKLTCPYHAWSWNLEGQLTKARLMAEDFDGTKHGLHRCHVELVEGLVFVNLSEEAPPSFSAAGAAYREFLQPHGLADAQVAHVEDYPTQANWKLVLENFLECYHCPGAHPEFSAGNSQVWLWGYATESKLRDFDEFQSQWMQRCESLGHKTGSDAERSHTRSVLNYGIGRQGIQPGYDTMSEGGRPVAPLMGEFTEYDGGETVGMISPFFAISACNDYAVAIRFLPRDAHNTDVRLTWLVRGDAVEGEDYDPDAVKWMWHVTLEQDTKLAEDNMRGVVSRRYQPGRYSTVESDTNNFVRWYLAQIG